MRKIIATCFLCLSIAGLLAATSTQTRKYSVQGLIYDLKHPEAERRIEAARLLGDNKIREAVPELMNTTADPDENVRLAVLTALDQIRDTRALPVYVTLTADPAVAIRRKAIDALVRLYALDESGFIAGTKKIFHFINPFDSNYNDLMVEPFIPIPPAIPPALEARLSDPDDAVRKAAVMSLGIFRSRGSVPRMGESLAKETKADIRIEYCRSFYKTGDAAACAPLNPLINDADKSVHDEAILTSGLLRCREAVDMLMDFYERGVKERKTVLGIIPASSKEDLQLKCFQALAMIGDPRAEKLFLPALNHETEDFRVAAAEGLARLANPANLPAAEKARPKAKGRRFQLALDFALYRMGRKELLPDLVKELGSVRYSDQVYLYLLEFAPADLPELYPLLRDFRGKIRIRLLDALGMTGNAATMQEVQKYTADSDLDVAMAALLAVRRIQGRS